MSKERELLLLALDFLDPRRWLDPSDQHALNVITRDIELLLAQPEQTEPVAWMWDEMFCEDWTTVSSVIKPSKSKYVDNVRPLYTAPQKREQDNTQYLLDQVSRLTAENAMLKEKWSTPKREPLSDGEITTNTPKLIPLGEKLAFHSGIRWAEHQHGIGVDDEN